MIDFESDFTVVYDSKINKLRENFNSLLVELNNLAPIGELSALQTPAPANSSLVGSINYLYSAISENNQPINVVELNNCYIPFSSSLYFSNNTSGNTRFTQVTSQLNSSEKDLVLYSKNDTVALYIGYTGAIGIGKIPTTALDINGTTKTTTLQLTNNTSSTTINYTGNSLTISSDSVITVGNQSNKSVLMNATGSPGNVGIGYTALETIPELFSIKTNNNSVGINLKTLNTNWSIKTSPSNSINFINDNDDNILTITQSGKVGILNNDPQKSLSVSGNFDATDIYFSGKLYSGAVEIISANGTNVSLKNIYELTALTSITASSFKIAATTVIESDAKIDWNKIKNISISTTSITEGSNLYYTATRVLNTLAASYFNLKKYTKTGLLAINPAVAGKSAIAYISDAGYDGLAISDGINWKYIPLGDTIT